MSEIVGILIVGSVGILLTVLGLLIWKKEMIRLFHDYHIENVSPENKKAFCTLGGIGILIMGIGMIVTAVLLGVTGSTFSFLCFAITFVIGCVLLIRAGIRYNR